MISSRASTHNLCGSPNAFSDMSNELIIEKKSNGKYRLLGICSGSNVLQ